MRVTFVLLLLVITHSMCFGNVTNTGDSVKVKNLQTNASNTPTSSSTMTRRNLKGTKKTGAVQEDMEEERGLIDKLKGLISSNPARSKEVKNLSKDPNSAAPLSKPSMPKRVIKNLKAYFKKLKGNATPIEKAFFVVLFVFALAALGLAVWAHT